jgi:peptidoglycan/LPS O-acetylase OafA/YrhL
VAIALVVFSHALGTAGFPLSRDQEWWAPLNQIGGLGVSIFFVLSGFLITLLMLRERERTASISVSAFYLRRALRILPAYVVYLIVVLVTTSGVNPRDWWIALTYTASILSPKGWEFVHLWSLSIEEQFYLVWPLLMLALSARKAAYAAALCVAGTIAARLIVLVAIPEYAWWIDNFTFTRLDCLALGCLLAMATTSESFARASAAMSTRLGLAGVAATFLLIVWFVLSTPTFPRLLLGSSGFVSLSGGATMAIEALKNVVAGLLVAAIMWSTANRPRSVLGRVLESGPLVLLGGVSYGLYLWQQYFLHWEASHWMYRWPVNLLFVALATAISWVCVEAPFLKLKDRLQAGSSIQRWTGHQLEGGKVS